MSSLVKLGPGKAGGPLGVTGDGAEHVIITNNLRGLRFKAGDVIKVGGQQDGLPVEGEVPANARVIIKTPTLLHPRKYEVVVSYNPELLKHGTVSCPTIIGPGRGEDIIIQFLAAKKTDLTKFDYIFELFMID